MKLLSGPSLGGLIVIIWSKAGLLYGPRSFRPIFIVVSGDFFQLSFCVFSCAQLSANFLKIIFKKVQKLGFQFLCLIF